MTRRQLLGLMATAPLLGQSNRNYNRTSERKNVSTQFEDKNADSTILVDSNGNPNHMVYIPKFNLDTIDASWAATVHPAFIVNGVEKDGIYIGKYQAGSVGGKCVSQPGLNPWTSINFDNSIAACAAMGTGWHLTTNTEWAAVALWCWKNSLQPRGNSNYGLSPDLATEGGQRVDGLKNGYTGSGGVCYTGSGPKGWNHNGLASGIADLNGNVWEWVGGMRQNSGEINVIQDNNAADNTISQAAGSAAWKAILQDGSLVAPGTLLSLKYDDLAGAAVVNTVITGSGTPSCTFESLPAASGVTIPALLKQLCLFPVGSGLNSDYFWLNNGIEGIPLRGGYWGDGAGDGVFDLSLVYDRSFVFLTFGFRPAFAI
jgi:hypothetical protein